jgi:transketolase
VALVDYNKFQLDGAIEDIMGLEPFAAKWEAMGWAVREIDGHDLDAVVEALTWAEAEPGPACILGHTVKGKGVSFMEHENRYHGVAPTEEELTRALRELGVAAADRSIDADAADAKEVR